MTCIIGMVKDDHIFMAGDLLGSNGFTKKSYPDSKVFVNGDFIIGYTSSFRMGQLLQYNWVQPPRLEKLTNREYLQVDVIESMKECFVACGYGAKDKEGDSGGNFLIGYKGGLYEMQHDFSLLKSEDFIAVGSGCYHAEAAMSILVDSGLPPDMILAKSISVAARFTTSVSEECTIATTDNDFEFSYQGQEPPSEDDLRAMPHDQLLAYMFDEDYQDENWEEVTMDDIERDVSKAFGNYYINEEGDLCLQGTIDTIINVRNKPGQVNISAKELKVVAKELGISFSPNASGTKMAALIINFMKEVVDILNG